MTLSDILNNGLPDLIDTVGGLASDVGTAAKSIKTAQGVIKGSDTKSETVAPTDKVINVQGPLVDDAFYGVPKRTLAIAGGVAAAVVVAYFIFKK